MITKEFKQTLYPLRIHQYIPYIPKVLYTTHPLPVLDAGVNAVSYAWTVNGSPITANTRTLSIVAGGVYTVTATSASGCTGADAIVVSISNNLGLNLGQDITLCQNDPKPTLDAGNVPGGTFVWTRNGAFVSNAQAILPDSSGLYVATVISSSGCVGIDSIRVTIGQTLVVDLGPDFSFCPSNPVVGLQAPTIPGATYVWSLDGQVLPNF